MLLDIFCYVGIGAVLILIGYFIGCWSAKPSMQKVGKIICTKDEDGDYFMLQFYDTDCIHITKHSAQVALDVTRIK